MKVVVSVRYCGTAYDTAVFAKVSNSLASEMLRVCGKIGRSKTMMIGAKSEGIRVMPIICVRQRIGTAVKWEIAIYVE
jgi:hypothetical protein